MERIADVGYINDECKHACISIYNPALLNPGGDFVQVVISIEGARRLRDNLEAFLAGHATGDASPSQSP